MPFPKWAVEPVFLCRKPLPPDKIKDTCELYAVTNVQLVNCLRQLSSVAKIADRIFDEIGSECKLLAERAHRLKDKVCIVQEVVDNLNARAVKVPVSDLSQAARILRLQKPYETKYEKTTQLFLPSTRPPCVDYLYGAACTTPVAIMCTMDKYRTDGLSSSELFMVTPVLGGERKRKQKRYLDIETRKPANFTLAKVKQDVVQSGSSSLPPMMSPSTGFLLKQNENLELERLPSPEEQAMLLSLQYPSTVVPVDTSGANFKKMSLLRRSLIHADFIIKRKKNKKSKRRHTFCEGQNREIEQAIRNVTNSSCQTDDLLDTTVSSSSASIHRSLSRRRSRSAVDTSRRKTLLDELDIDSSQQESNKDSATEDDKETSPSKASTINIKKSKTMSSLRSKSFNPISSLSAAISIAAVKMRNSARGTSNKQDDGRSSSGNWSASSSTRASVDSDHQHTVSPVDGISSPSRNSVGKDSVLSDATQIDQHNRSRDDILPIQSLASSPIKRKKFGALNLPWEPINGNGRISNTPTPDFTSHCSSSTPVIRSPYAGRRGVSDDGDSSVYSVDTDGYYTSMHTDSGLWCNALNNKLDEEIPESGGFRERKESQSSVSTIDNSSINSFLSKSATECSSNSGSLKRQPCPDPPPRISSNITSTITVKNEAQNKEQEAEESDKSYSPQLQNGSTSESDHEVGDRIRVKTTITANRYPSMCAVSPETSDDEIAEMKNKTLTNINVIVAEVHREDKCDDKTDSNQPCNVPINTSKSSINMYRSETPLPSSFSSSFTQNCQPIATSSPRSGVNITTFSPDLNESRNTNNNSSSLKLSDLGENLDSDDDITVTGSPSPQSRFDKSLIPLKYAQRITVTPISRSESPSSNTGTIKRTPLRSSLNTNTTEKSSEVTNNKKDVPSYISFQAPDSPVSSISTASKVSTSEKLPNSPNSSLPRPVARVTLDPSGKVVYSSNSLGRTITSTPNKLVVERTYATLPLCQTHTESRPITPIKDTPNSSNVRMSLEASNLENSSNNNQTVSKSLAPMIYSSFRSGTRSAVSANPQENSNTGQTSVQNPSGSTIESSSKADSRFSISRENSTIKQIPVFYPLGPNVQSTIKNDGFSNTKDNANSHQLPALHPSPSTTHSSFKTDARLSMPGNDKDNSIHNQTKASVPMTYSSFRGNLRESAPSKENSSNYLTSICKSFTPRTHSSSFIQNQNTSSSRPNPERHDFSFRPSRGGRFCRSYFPSHLISPPPASKTEDKQLVKGVYSGMSESKGFVNTPAKTLTENPAWQKYPVPSLQDTESCSKYTAPSRQPYSPSVVPNAVSDNNLYSPCSAKIWPGRLYTPQNNISAAVRLKQPVANNTSSDLKKSTTPQTSFISLRPPDLIPSGESPPSTLDITSSAGGNRKLNPANLAKVAESEKESVLENGQNLKSLSATELFAIIHSSKKKHNIKSDSEISMSPMSSRSVSPALSQTSLSKLQPVETGVLSKRSDSNLSSPDKTKWCNSMPSNFRKQMANDKMGPTKPTSMHDFKMLLLQTRTGSGDSSPRPSAAELLKVSPTRNSPVPFNNNNSKLPVPSSFKSPTSQYSYQSPTYSPGHGTVPVKRNMRTRSPYLTRYDSAYPPIMEDCLEETESCYEDSKCLNQSPHNQTQIYRMPDAVPRPTPLAKATSTWV